MGLVPRPERWPSGRRRAPAKGVWVKSPSRVRIPPSPPIASQILVGLDQLTLAATKRGFEPEIWKRGFDKIAEGDFGRRARVARRARAEGPSQSLPLRHQKIPAKTGSCGGIEATEKNRLFSTASLLPAMSGFWFIHMS